MKFRFSGWSGKSAENVRSVIARLSLSVILTLNEVKGKNLITLRTGSAKQSPFEIAELVASKVAKRGKSLLSWGGLADVSQSYPYNDRRGIPLRVCFVLLEEGIATASAPRKDTVFFSGLLV